MQSDQIQQPNIIQPPTVLIYASRKYSDPFLIDNIKRMILPRTGPILTGSHHLPSLELQIQILRNLPQHINKQKVVIEVAVLVLPPKTKDTVVFQLISIGGIQVVGMEYFMSRDAFVGL